MQTKAYGTLEFDQDKQEWVVGKLEPHVSLRFKQLFPRVSTSKLPPFRIAHSEDACADLQWFTLRYPLTISEGDKQLLNNTRDDFYANRAATEAILLPTWKGGRTKGLRKGQTLRHYQKSANAFHMAVKRLLLVDAIGSGKTYTAIGSALQEGTLPAAFVVQPHLPDQFKEKIEEFSKLTVHIIKSKKPYSLPKADVYIFKYSIVGGWVDIFAQGFFKLAMFDEVQELRHGDTTMKGAGARALADHAQFVLGTTATPIYGYGIEFFNILDIIKKGILGRRDEFIREWCQGDDKKVSDPDALGSYLREAQVMLRRTKRELYGDIEEPNIIIEKVDYDEELVKTSEDIAKQLAITTLTGSFTERGQASRELDMRLREATGISKAANVARFVRMLVESGERVILSGWHRDVYEIWQRELNDLGVAMYTGSESSSQKKKSKEAFISGEAQVLILSHASGAGLDGIQHVCSTVVIGELAWSKEIHAQIIGRVDRDGQLEPVNAFIMTSDYGSDPVIMDILGIKHSQQKGVLDPGEKVTKIKSDRSRMTELAKRYLEARGVKVDQAA